MLLTNGISDVGKRRTILASYLFEQGVLLDQSWFKDQEQRWYPGIFFSTQPHDELAAATIFLPSTQYGMNFHEYAHGAADWALENEGDPNAIEVVSVHAPGDA